GFPGEDDLAGVPGISLHVPDLEADIDDELDFASLEVHAAQTARTRAHIPRSHSLLQRLTLGKLSCFRPANPEVHEVVVGIQAHVAIGRKGGWDGSADALI